MWLVTISLKRGYSLEHLKMICQCHFAVGASCEDHHPKCLKWAAKGECDNNPKWMLQHCRMSCGQCSQGKPLVKQ